ncbi:GAF domain-containing protein [Parafrankia irregularis]|uniref:GAF domain-containing protein n=2 Tax=Frankiaceae TaxID=74712 RepID=A0A0S4QYG5_9ACTN|nr:SpoIIE family protein phosphatase [Parafrankia sp. CH37]CUU59590.1 GAF domain-containing protein [Parafrankia irregularis]
MGQPVQVQVPGMADRHESVPTLGAALDDAGRCRGGRSLSPLEASLELLDFTDGLSTALTVEDVARVAFQTVTRLGVTFAGMVLFEEDGDLGPRGGPPGAPLRTRVITWPRPPAVDRAWAAPGSWGPAVATQVMQTGRARFDASAARYLRDFPDRAEVFAELGIEACASLPVVADGGDGPLGVLLLAWPEPRRFGPDCQAFLHAMASAYGRAIGRARRYERQMCTVETLQRAILPQQLPVVPGVQLTARYLPAGRDVGLGGDWYDATVLPDGTLALAVGDVGGHGLRATALMAELSHSARAYALHGLSPAAITTQLSANLASSGSEILATAVIAQLDPATGRFSWSCAGHPPPLHLAGEGGRPRYLSEVHGPMLGVLSDHRYGQSGLRLTGPGLLLYTDGLVERRDVSISQRLEALAASATRVAGRDSSGRAPSGRKPSGRVPSERVLDRADIAAAAASTDLDQLCDALLAEIAGPGEREDDVCVLGVTLI